MATWHQQRNPGGLRGLWEPDRTQWKVVDDKPNRMASSISFSTKDAAETYISNAGGVLIPPKEKH